MIITLFLVKNIIAIIPNIFIKSDNDEPTYFFHCINFFNCSLNYKDFYGYMVSQNRNM